MAFLIFFSNENTLLRSKRKGGRTKKVKHEGAKNRSWHHVSLGIKKKETCFFKDKNYVLYLIIFFGDESGLQLRRPHISTLQFLFF